MNDIQNIKSCYKIMYQAMIDKNSYVLNIILDDSFILIHMTGMNQSKYEFISAIDNGVLNYYSAEHQSIDVSINENKAFIDGKSIVSAAVFGGGKHTWRLRQQIELVYIDKVWKIKESIASMY